MRCDLRSERSLPSWLWAVGLAFCLMPGFHAAAQGSGALEPDQAELILVYDDRPSKALQAPAVELIPLWPSAGGDDPRSERERAHVTLRDDGSAEGDVAGDGIFVGKARLPKAEFALARLFSAEGAPKALAVQRVSLPSESRLTLLIQAPASPSQEYHFQLLGGGASLRPAPRAGAHSTSGDSPGSAPSAGGQGDGSGSAGADGSDPGPLWYWGPWAWGWTAIFALLAVAAGRRSLRELPSGAAPAKAADTPPQLSPQGSAPETWSGQPLTPGTTHIACDGVSPGDVAAALAVYIAGVGGWPTCLLGADAPALRRATLSHAIARFGDAAPMVFSTIGGNLDITAEGSALPPGCQVAVYAGPLTDGDGSDAAYVICILAEPSSDAAFIARAPQTGGLGPSPFTLTPR